MASITESRRYSPNLPAGFLPIGLEDFDVSIPIQRSAGIAYVSQVSITHGPGEAAYPDQAHLGLFVRFILTTFVARWPDADSRSGRSCAAPPPRSRWEPLAWSPVDSTMSSRFGMRWREW